MAETARGGPEPTAEWMFADCAMGAFGIHSLARFNPLRWSGALSLEAAAEQLERLEPQDSERPVILKVPAGVLSPEQRFADATEAVAHLQRVGARARRASASWAVELTAFLCARGAEQRFEGKVPLLDEAEFSSVQFAVDRLNVDSDLCPSGLCVVCSKRVDGYVLLYRADKREEAKALFGIGDHLSWKEFARRHDGKEGYSFGDFTRGLLGRLAFLGDAWASQGRFDGRKLVMVRGGCLVDRYETLRELGAGAQGAARLLRRRRTGQEYAAKECKGEDALEDMSAELEKMRALRHPNCAKIVEFLESRPEGKAIAICEFAPHGDLARYLHGAAPLPDAVLLGIFKQAMSGVAFLHASGCVHNDLKPENLLVFCERRTGEVPRVALADFGCARFVTGEQRLKFGDPRYMSPENIRQMQEYLRSDVIIPVDLQPAGDVWSMGVTLYELLSNGIIPFLYEPCSLQRVREAGVFERLQEVILAPDKVEVWAHCPAAPHRMATLLPFLLEKDAHNRQSAQKVLAILREQEPASNCTKRVELTVQQHQACQILLNCMMWRLQSEHVDALCSVFERFGVSGTGRISREEFRCALESFARDASSADDIFDMADIDRDGSLEFNEFAAISFDWGSMDEETLDKHIEELLEDLSGGCGGAATEQELSDFFGAAIERAELLKLFMRIDTGNTGLVSAPDLRRFLRQHRASALPPVVCDVPVP